VVEVVAIRLALEYVARPEWVCNSLDALLRKQKVFCLGLDFLEDMTPELLGLGKDLGEGQVAILLVESVIELIQREVLDPGGGRLQAAECEAKPKPTIVRVDVSDDVLDGPFALCRRRAHFGPGNPLEEGIEFGSRGKHGLDELWLGGWIGHGFPPGDEVDRSAAQRLRAMLPCGNGHQPLDSRPGRRGRQEVYEAAISGSSTASV